MDSDEILAFSEGDSIVDWYHIRNYLRSQDMGVRVDR